MTTNNLTLADKMRAAHVKRWHLVRTLREQNIAEHSFVVMLIATEIMKRSDRDCDQMGAIHGEMGYTLLRWAMWHDLLEVKTGDLATPFKKRLNEAVPGVLDMIEEEFSTDFVKISDSTGQTVKMVVKMADMIEAITFYMEDGHGARKEEVLGLLIASLQEYIDTMPCIYYRSHGAAAASIAMELGIPVSMRS